MTTQEIELMDAKTNHILHLILSILTGGIWLIVWLIVASNNTEKRKRLIAELNGDRSYEKNLSGGVTLIVVSLFFVILFVIAKTATV